MTVSVAASIGTFDGHLSARSYDIRVHSPHSPFAVGLTNAAGEMSTLPEMNSLAQLDYAEQGWFFVKGFTGGRKGGVVVVKTSSISTSEGFSVMLSAGANVPHISLTDCNATKSDVQSFDFAESSGEIRLRSNSSSCLTMSSEKDADSGTPALEMLPCAADSSSLQQWNFTTYSNLNLRSDGTRCVDFDRSDRKAIIYNCGGPPPQINQVWSWESGTGRIVSGLDGSCFTSQYLMAKLPEGAAVLAIV